MSESTVRSVLRIIAVVTILIGATMLVSFLLTIVAASGGLAGSAGILLLTPLVVVGEGLLLFVASQSLARRIVQ